MSLPVCGYSRSELMADADLYVKRQVGERTVRVCMECDNNVSAHQPGATATPKVVEQNDTPMATDVIKEETKEEDCIIQLTQSDHDMSIGQILNAETPAPTKEEEEFTLQFMADDFVDGLDKEFDSKAFIDNNGYTNTPQSSVKPSVPDDDVVEIEPVAPLVKPAASPITIKLPITPPRPSTGSLSVNVPPPAPRTLPPNISLKCPVTNKPIIEKKECEESGDEYVTESSSSESSDDEDFAIPVRTPPSPKAPKYHYTSTKITACNYPPPTPQSVVSATTKKRTREDDDDDEVEWEPKALTPPKKLKAVKAKSDPSNVKQRDTISTTYANCEIQIVHNSTKNYIELNWRVDGIWCTFETIQYGSDCDIKTWTKAKEQAHRIIEGKKRF